MLRWQFLFVIKISKYGLKISNTCTCLIHIKMLVFQYSQSLVVHCIRQMRSFFYIKIQLRIPVSVISGIKSKIIRQQYPDFKNCISEDFDLCVDIVQHRDAL